MHLTFALAPGFPPNVLTSSFCGGLKEDFRDSCAFCVIHRFFQYNHDYFLKFLSLGVVCLYHLEHEAMIFVPTKSTSNIFTDEPVITAVDAVKQLEHSLDVNAA